MNYNNGLANYLTGPSGRFDLADPSTQAMVRDVMGSPNNAPKYGVSLPEIFQLHRALNAISSRTPQPQQTTVADDLKMAALQAVQSPNAAPPQMPQMPPQGIQQAMPQAQMPQDPMDQGLGGMPAPAMDNAQFAGGGIIAFADQGFVESDTGLNVLAGEAGAMLPPGTSREMYARILAEQQAARAAASVPTIQEELAAVRAAREAAGITGKLGEERLKKLEGAASKDAEAEARSERFALAKAGFEMAAAAAKPGAKFLGSAAQGATAGLTDYVASQEKLRTLQEKRDAEIANIQNLQRAEDAGLVKDASGRIEKARDRIIDLDKSINTTQTAIAGQMSAAERSQAEIEARAKEAAAARGVQMQIAKLHAAGQPLDVQKVMEMPQFNVAHGDKDPEKRLEIATELLAARRASPEKTGNALINATKDAAKEWGKRTGVGGDPVLARLAKQADSKDPKIAETARAKLEAARQRHYAGYDLEAPSLGEEAALVSGKPAGGAPSGGGSSVLKFDKQGNPVR